MVGCLCTTPYTTTKYMTTNYTASNILGEATAAAAAAAAAVSAASSISVTAFTLPDCLPLPLAEGSFPHDAKNKKRMSHLERHFWVNINGLK